MKLINKTENGQLSFCKCCDTYQLEFGNIIFSIPQKGFNDLKKYVNDIDGEDCTRQNNHFSTNRKILLQFSTKGIMFCMNKEELEELKELYYP